MTLDDKPEKSKVKEGLNTGVTKIGGEERTIKNAKRKTKEGKEKQELNEKDRMKNEKIMKAALKKKEDDEESWESVEEDAPVIKLEELLENLKIDDSKPESGDEHPDDSDDM